MRATALSSIIAWWRACSRAMRAAPASTTCVDERHLRPFEGVQEPSRITGPTARPGEPLEVVGSDRLIGVGVAQRGPRHRPLALVVRGPGVVEERLTRGHAASLSRRTFRTTLPSGRQLYDLGVR